MVFRDMFTFFSHEFLFIIDQDFGNWEGMTGSQKALDFYPDPNFEFDILKTQINTKEERHYRNH